MKIIQIAGEASGDMYGAYLANKIKKLNPDCELSGMGGVKMEEAGVKIAFPISLDVIGAFDFLFNLPKGLILLNRVCGFIKETKPDIVVLIDSAEFNLHLIKKIRGMDIKTVWLFPPTAWAWRKNRAKIVSKYASLVLATLPFERDFYRAYGAQVCFIGHPLLDIVKTNGKLDTLDRKRAIISLLPGSRKQEVKRNLPIMISSARLLSSFIPELQFFLILAPGIEKSFVEPFISHFNITMVSHSYNLMAQSDILIASSGTATLEGAILAKPMVVVYKLDWFSSLLAKHLVKIKYASLPNIISNKMVVPEFLGDNARDELIAKEAVSILNNKEKREDMQKDLLLVKDMIGSPGAMERAALAIIKLVKMIILFFILFPLPSSLFPLSLPEELVYNVKILGINAGYQKLSINEHSEREFKIVSHTKTNPFFSRFYKVDNYIETIVEKKTFLPVYIKESISEGGNKKSYEGTLTQKEDVFNTPSLIYHLRNTSLDIGMVKETSVITCGKIKKVRVVVEGIENVRVMDKVYEAKRVFCEGITVWFSKDDNCPIIIGVTLKGGMGLKGYLKK